MIGVYYFHIMSKKILYYMYITKNFLPEKKWRLKSFALNSNIFLKLHL